MPGPIISKYLEPQNYSTFYRLAHNYCETMLLPCTSISVYADMLVRLLNRLPVTAQMSAVPARRTASDLHSLATTLNDEIRLFFFPCTMGDFAVLAEFDAFYQQRWQPFDGETWDTLLAAFNAMMQPHMQHIRVLIQALEEVPLLDDSTQQTPEGDLPRHSLARLVRQIQQAQQKLAVFLQPEEYDIYVRSPEHLHAKYGW